MSESSRCPVRRTAPAAETESSQSACPVLHNGSANAEAIDPLNMMPAPNQEPRQGQQMKLSQARCIPV